MRVAIGADHAGLPLKEPLKALLAESGHEIVDLGTHSPEPCDYPDIARAVGEAVILERVDRGIVLCGSAQGASIAANKLSGIRAAVGHDNYSAHQSVEHDDANVLCLGARVIGQALALEIVGAWMAAHFTGEERHSRRVQKVRDLERRMPLLELGLAGQSAWMDNISLDLLNGDFRQLIARGITGVTSNPTIMEKSISSSVAYDPAVRDLVRRGASARDIAVSLWVDDIRGACDQLRPIYDLTQGADGFASIEVDAELANDTQRTIQEGRRLWGEVDRPNVMIKVPATPAGLPAIQQLTSEGVNVNITLLFSQTVYEQVMESYLTGLERWMQSDDHTGAPPASVASFFVSRVDSKVDAALKAKIAESLSDEERAELDSLRGTAAIANAKLAYQSFLTHFAGPRWNRLANQGARVQRPLWASTSTKDPSYRDVLYVEELIGPDTVNTMPPQTIEAFADHGYVRPSVAEGLDEARQQLASLHKHGIDLARITEQLQQEGVEAFATSFDALLQSIDRKRDAIIRDDQTRLRVLPGPISSEITEVTGRFAEQGLVERIWKRDASLWTSDAGEAASIENRLGWLDVALHMREQRRRLTCFAEQAVRDGYKHVVLLGMGGSSLAPEVFKRTFGSAPGYPTLTVLDTTVPDAIVAAEQSIEISKSLFIAASKSGTTVETLSHLAYFWEKTGEQGEQFTAITDPGTPLEALARERGFRDCFVNPPDIGGRYSALSFFGLVPAALLGLDLEEVFKHALNHRDLCRELAITGRNTALQLGVFMGVAARAGRDKLTLITPDAICSFGLWVEQLIAESTGKSGTGIIPIVSEQAGLIQAYGHDRAFVVIESRDESAGTAEHTDLIQSLTEAGHPVAVLQLDGVYDLFGQCLTWEFATAVAGVVLNINPFNEPNVQEAKDQTNLALDAFKQSGQLPSVAHQTVQAVAQFIGSVQPGDYLAIQAYLPYDESMEKALDTLRLAARDKYHVATTVGFGPRFLHSTGQLHKGGPSSGAFVQIVCDNAAELPIPEAPYSFAVLNKAQAVGDYQALKAHGLRVIRLDVGRSALTGIQELTHLIAGKSL
ncbi:MAG: bifunctional transaldolase/phosoglucose isomerase [Chloroflexota bacterium]